VQQNDKRSIAGLDVVQAHVVADFGVTLPKLDPDVREQAGGGHHDLLGRGLSETTPVGLDKQDVSAGRRDTVAQAVG
jgi:hypothetical protein